MTANDVTGTADITNRFGSVEVRNLGKGLTIHSNNGGIDASNVGGGANIANSFGKVVVTDAKGDLFVQNQNGESPGDGHRRRRRPAQLLRRRAVYAHRQKV